MFFLIFGSRKQKKSEGVLDGSPQAFDTPFLSWQEATNATESPCYPVLVLEVFWELCGGLKSLQELGCSSGVYHLSSLWNGLFLIPSTGKKNETRHRLHQLQGKASAIAQWWRTLTRSSSKGSGFESQLRRAHNFLYLQF